MKVHAPAPLMAVSVVAAMLGEVSSKAETAAVHVLHCVFGLPASG